MKMLAVLMTRYSWLVIFQNLVSVGGLDAVVYRVSMKHHWFPRNGERSVLYRVSMKHHWFPRNGKRSNHHMNQSELEANTCRPCQARENACEEITIGFGFTSDWSRKWRETF